MGSEDFWKSILSEGADPGFAEALDEHIRVQVAALAAGEPVSATLAQTVFGQVAWPVALGRPPGNLATGFHVECRHDTWRQDPDGRPEGWVRRQVSCPVRVIEGRSDAETWRVNFVASMVPDNPDPPAPAGAVYTHLAVTIRNAARWGGADAASGIGQTGAKRVAPGPLTFLKQPGAMLFEFAVLAAVAG